MKPYKDVAYSENRLAGCIIRTLDGDPIYVRGSAGGSKFVCQRLFNKEEITVDNSDFDLDPVPLGFVNTNSNRLTYLTRTPMREDWRQGLRSNNARSLMGLHFNDISFKQLYDTITGKYPSVEAAIKRQKSGYHLAFHRHWALYADGGLLHRDKVVGRVVDDRLVLLDKYNYLDRKLEEAQIEKR